MQRRFQHVLLAQTGLLENGLDESTGELLPLRHKILIVANETLPEGGQVDAVFDLIDG